MVQVPGYRSGVAINPGRGAFQSDGPTAPVIDSRTLSAGANALERGGDRLARGAARLRQGAESVVAGAAASQRAALGAQQAAAGIVDAAQRLNAYYVRDSERDAKQLSIERAKRVREIYRGNDDGPGYFSLRGQEAIDSREATVKKIEEINNELSEQAKNPLAKRMFDQETGIRTNEEFGRMATHYYAQEAVATSDASEARKGQFISEAADSYREPGIIKRSIKSIHAEIESTAEVLGKPPDMVAREKTEATTAVHKAVFEQFLGDQDIEAARDYYEENEESIQAEMRPIMKKALRRGDSARLTEARARVAEAKSVLEVGANPAGLAKLRVDLAGYDGPQARALEADLLEAVNTKEVVKDFNGKTLAEQASIMNGLTQYKNTQELTGSDVRLYDRIQKSLAYKKDQFKQGRALTWGFQNGLIEEVPAIDFANPDPNVFRTRMRQVVMMQDQGPGVTPLSDNEVSTLAEHLTGEGEGQGTSLDESVGLMAAVVDGAGHQGASMIAERLADKKPEIAAAMSMASERPLVSRKILQGGRLRREKGNAIAFLDRDNRVDVARGVLDNLTIPGFTNEMESIILSAADAIYANDFAGDSADEDLMEKAILEVTGGLVTHNGRTNLPPVPNMDQDEFEDLIGSMVVFDLLDYGNGTPMIGGEIFTTVDLESNGFFGRGVENQLVSIGNGAYSIYQEGNGWIKTDQGDVYILELGDYHRDGN